MIPFSRFTLSNGLRVIVHEDKSTPMVAVNLLYDVGARDENPEQTGFAHLFEHLMFGGSAHAPNFDGPMQRAGGENNAFTNHDITNFYETVPADNLEVALWLESDRMYALNCTQKSLDVQRKVVVEEFKETCLNEPYGDVWHHVGELAYQEHPYRWPTIGRVPAHISEAELPDVKSFYKRFYCPNNAILVLAGNTDMAQAKPLVEKWFGDIKPGPRPERALPIEPVQTAIRKKSLEAEVPNDALYLAFHMCGRRDQDYYAYDLLSDIMCNGSSSRLYRRLLKQKELFSEIDCFVSGTIDPGLLIVEAKPTEGVDLETAKAAIWAELEEIKRDPVPSRELEKYKNKMISNLLFSEMNVLNKAINLAFFEVIGDAKLINKEPDFYRAVSVEDIQRVARDTFREENCTEVVYQAI